MAVKTIVSVATVVLTLSARAAFAKFTLDETWQGTTFFDHFNFITSGDPTLGTVTYVSQATAASAGLISTSAAKAWMRVESSKVLGSTENRQSVRLESKRQFNSGLFVISLSHMPTGCGTWPAFWMYGPSWPAGGEIDIIEGVSNETRVHTTLHTSDGCDMTGQRTDLMIGTWASSGSTSYTNCYVNAYGSNMGCATRGKENSIGAGFNRNGGGVYATSWNSTMIAIWFWPAGSAPSDISSANPNPLTWGLPQSRFPLGTWCDKSHFKDNWVTFDTTLCGEWAGKNFGSDCPAIGSSWADCNTFVRSNPAAFKEAYWEVNYVKIFSWDGNADTAPTTPTTPTTPSTASQPNPPTWPSTVTVLDPSTPTASQTALDAAFAANGGHTPAWNGEFSSKRFTFLLLPGTHAVTANVGYYTSIIGAGAKPTDTVINTLTCSNGDFDYTGGALANFWRSAENMHTANKVVWAVSQAAPMRRMSIANDMDIWQYNSGCCAGYASGGFLADSTVTGTIASASQQQWFTRNTYAKAWNGGVWNMVFVGNSGGFPSSHCTNVGGNPSTTISATPVIAEKPYVKYASGKYFLVIPNVERNKVGPTTDFTNAVTVGFESVYVANAGDSAAKINTMLAAGLHVVMAPGIYSLTEPIAITKANTVLLGLGFATLVSTTGKPCITVADVDGVRVSSVLLQAGPVNTDALIQWGATAGFKGTTPGFMHDVFARVGGPNDQSIQQVSATTMMHVVAGNVIIDNTWLWRADHGVGGLVKNSNNPCIHGAVIDGDDVIAYGLAAEHTLGDMVQWNGNNGQTYFYQSEYPYDVTQANYGDKGYVAYRVANSVTKHLAWGVGAYSYFRDNAVSVESAIKTPSRAGIIFTNSLSVFLNGKGGINHIVNDQGDAVLAGTTVKYLCAYGPGTDTSCYLGTLPTGATAWNTCGPAVASGSSCKFTCSSAYTAVAGTCSVGSWTVTPTCSQTVTPTTPTTPTTPSTTSQPNPPTWPSTVTVLDPSTPTASQTALDAAFAANGGHTPAWNGEFSSKRFTFLLLPGKHAVTANVGYYTSIIGAGAKPTDTVINTLTCSNGDFDYTGGALANFWRSAENMHTANKVVWAVSQAAPMRRMSIANDMDIWQYNSGCCAGYASGGFLADSTVTGTIASASQQQWFTRNTYAKAWNGGVWNMVFVGNSGGFPSSHCTNVGGNPSTTISATPVIAEKPYVKYASGKYFLVIPNVERNKVGPTTDFTNAVTVGFESVYVANAGDSAAKINTMLAAGLHVVMAPGIYSLTEPIAITKANTVLLGLGFATLVSTTGKPCITVADVDGVRVSSVLLQAGPVNTDDLIRFGVTTGYRGTSYSFMHDVFARVGGPNDQSIQQVSATTMMHVVAGNVIIDNTWLWRADHGVGGLVKNSNNPCIHGAVIDGDDVIAYGLAAEHTLGDMVQWNGNNGQTYFYQSEYPYDVTQANYGDKGYVAYRVANSVTKHTAWGVGAYSYFRDYAVTVESAIKTPNRPGIIFTNSLSVFLNGNGGIKHVLNSQGDSVMSGTVVKYLCAFGPGTDTNCYIDALPTGATAWNTCSASVAAGSTCALKCASGYTPVTGKCEITGSWSTKPICSK